MNVHSMTLLVIQQVLKRNTGGLVIFGNHRFDHLQGLNPRI